MNIYFGILIAISTFCCMEGVAWFTHKYIMHGLFWNLHEDHHVVRDKHFFEKNDAFFLIFAIPSFLCILFGTLNGGDFKMFIGIGIAIYGLCYFLVHDIFIHQRFKLFTRTNNSYLRAIRKAHKVHHKHQTKEDGECFGMLFVPLTYFKEAKQAQVK